MDSKFVELDIVNYLKNESPTLFANVEWLYNNCELLLGEIPKVFSNYTLHDIGHSTRVIKYMNDLVKDRLKDFSCLHLAIIIYVGLLHDTGMVVSDDEAKELYSIFSTQNPEFQKWSEDKKTDYLQEYVRKNHGKRVRKVLKQKVNDCTTISSRLFVGDTESYNISDIIADICQAHMEDSEWIAKHLHADLTFGNDRINPQHIAVLLRY